MAITVNWATQVINVPQADLTFIGGAIYELDIDTFRLALKALEAGADGMSFLDTHNHNPPVTVSGVTIARVVEIINGYTVTFEDGQYAVNLVGANSNIADVTNVNQVSIRPFNTAGLIEVPTGAGPTPAEIATRVWTEILDTPYDASTMLQMICAAAAGRIHGAASTEVTIRNVADTRDIIVATVDADGNRISVTYDP